MSQALERALQALASAVQSVFSVAIADDLTPLGNSIALRKIGNLVGTSPEAPSIVIFGDLNRFKSLNDTHGHETGDAAISHVGRMIDTLLVKGVGCQAFRRSGDEFVILSNSDDIEVLRNQLTQFATCHFHFNNQLHTVSMSFGLSRTDGQSDFHKLMERAEIACQVAKTFADGTVIEWTAALAPQGHRNVRGRCASCGTKITCDLPATVPNTITALTVCPICGAQQP